MIGTIDNLYGTWTIQKWRVLAGWLLICLYIICAMAPNTECVCLILPILCFLPLNQALSSARLTWKRSAPWYLSSGTWGAHTHRAEGHVAPPNPPFAVGGTWVPSPSIRTGLLLRSPFWAFCPHSLRTSLISGHIILENHWNHTLHLLSYFPHIRKPFIPLASYIATYRTNFSC